MTSIIPLLYNTSSEPLRPFKLVADWRPGGDQPTAIQSLIEGIEGNIRDQVLLGVTGSGKTFTIANVIEKVQKPTLVMAPNKTLAAQLYQEMKSFFPGNAVEYFVSYYDYYQPEAYVRSSDTYIEKSASINEEIDRMRHSATRALLERRDVIIVASVSCIYGIGGVTTYSEMTLPLQRGLKIQIQDLLRRFVELHYKRNDIGFNRGNFRVRGDTVDIFPVHSQDRAWRFNFLGDEIESIFEMDSMTGRSIESLNSITVFANSHYVTPGPTLLQAIEKIEVDLEIRLKEFKEEGKLLEAQRIEQRTLFDLEMMRTTGTCQGIENYSRYISGKNPGEPPPTLFEYLPKDALLVVDESHVSVPQIGGMYVGDQARKGVLSEFGFRLPSCRDNRPLKFEEWNTFRPQTIYVSATPGPFELNQTGNTFVEQIIRPTGLVDPICEVHSCEGQIDHLMHRCLEVIQNNQRVLVTTLTKKMAEALCAYLSEHHLKVRYLHSDIETLERIEIIKKLRLGAFDILVGINLLREGLDIPECALVAILDADKEGFLRSKTSLIQTIGRAARNVDARVLLYANKITPSLEGALEETNRRREKQIAHNEANSIKPHSTKRFIQDEQHLVEISLKKEKKPSLKRLKARRNELEKLMKKAAENLEFEQAVKYRDALKEIEYLLLEVE